MKKVLAAIMSVMLCAGVAVSGATRKPVKVFILAGQSNMEGHARITTFDYIGDDPETAPILKEMRGPDGEPRVCDNVWISYLTASKASEDGNGEVTGKLTAGYGARGGKLSGPGEKIGPEFTFGIYMDKAIEEPILIIKTAWGGKSLFKDYRPPSAGPYEPTENEISKGKYETEEQKKALKEATGHYYRLMVNHVKTVLKDIKRVYPDYDERQGYEIAGFVWFQGFNDMVNRGVYPNRDQPGGYGKYSEWLADFIRDVRKDLAVPKMPFVIGVMGVGGADGNMLFRDAMAAPAALPEFQGNVVAVQTSPFWDEPLARIEEKRGRVKKMAYSLKKKSRNGPNADGRMTKAEQKAYLEKYEAEIITPEERAMRERGASNAGYHYLGCAKTMALIGKAFAEAMLNMPGG